jgi:hypothetical protein
MYLRMASRDVANRERSELRRCELRRCELRRCELRRCELLRSELLPSELRRSEPRPEGSATRQSHLSWWRFLLVGARFRGSGFAQAVSRRQFRAAVSRKWFRASSFARAVSRCRGVFRYLPNLASIKTHVFGSSTTDVGSLSDAISNCCSLRVISIFSIRSETPTSRGKR